MRTVLGIDAAWTLTQPSGLALVGERAGAWQLLALSPSYQSFHALAAGDLRRQAPLSGSRPDAAALLASSSKLCGRRVDLIAIDIPLAHSPITGRRVSDNRVSRAYGARRCGTHSPSDKRPGPISDELRDGFDRAGYALQTNSISRPGLIEVYPHPALVELTGASERLRYKVSNVGRYWPNSTIEERRMLLFQEWTWIVALLDRKIRGVADELPPPDLDAPAKQLKAYEDMLDAIVCAWVAICALAGQVTPYGDQDSAIWIPNSGLLRRSAESHELNWGLY
jgi:predicted RNase H-like nuclease